MRVSALLSVVAAMYHEGHEQEHTIVLRRSARHAPQGAMAVDWRGATSMVQTRRSRLGVRMHLDSEAMRNDRQQVRRQRQAASTQASISAEPVSLSNLGMIHQHMGPLGVGTTIVEGQENPQETIHVLFDTGSTNMWIASTMCGSEVCTGRSRYDWQKSATYQESPDDSLLKVAFGTGELVGPLAIDDFHVGSFVVENQTFGMIAQENGEVFKHLPFEGLLGLGFPSMSVDGVTPFFDNIMKQKILKSNEFAFYFTEDPSDPSAMFFGGVDKRFYQGEIKMLPVVQEHYWTLNLLELRLGNTPVNIDKNGNKIHKVIVDSGSTLFTAPTGTYDVLANQFDSVECSDLDQHPERYPDLTYVLEDSNGEPYELVVSAKEYMFDSYDGAECDLAFMELNVPDKFGPAFMLGEVFMSNFFTVFSRGDGSPGSASVGFAKARHDKEALEALRQGRVPGTVTGHARVPL
mmetsp:Transcript_45704/g.99208  ORF Transcript_45704/g.99208 Transcript_45704/m.99208 type:complete len:463 (-) Transcript_45704:132-1520(-)|eukprot:CAMPEP_0204259704 /NCGR_PEP_ID=MMETSP0468-20130131/5824_1 /ASSEMBLY_ACC=CAM_ASM_000383 /TAXON_ID=2969 /ORGANISM="Oxyrrhis marina" /LENGTH=462 /DNA_ID=CAMNT_0051234027 /DNA_START=87 /DNA_END=1475 /DNA_ORIENTATION=-